MMKSVVLVVLTVLVLIRGLYLEPAGMHGILGPGGWLICEVIGKPGADDHLYGFKTCHAEPKHTNDEILQILREKSVLKNSGGLTGGTKGVVIGTTVPRGKEFDYMIPNTATRKSIEKDVKAFKRYYGGKKEAGKEIEARWK